MFATFSVQLILKGTVEHKMEQHKMEHGQQHTASDGTMISDLSQ